MLRGILYVATTSTWWSFYTDITSDTDQWTQFSSRCVRTEKKQSRHDAILVVTGDTGICKYWPESNFKRRVHELNPKHVFEITFYTIFLYCKIWNW